MIVSIACWLCTQSEQHILVLAATALKKERTQNINVKNPSGFYDKHDGRVLNLSTNTGGCLYVKINAIAALKSCNESRSIVSKLFCQTEAGSFIHLPDTIRLPTVTALTT